MLIGPIALAVVGAFSLALGSALQERDAVGAPGRAVGRVRFVLHLLGQPRWLLGTAAAVAGVALHLAALSSAPLVIIQPLGVTGLLFAIVLAAAFNRRHVLGAELWAGAAVVAGLGMLIAALPHEADVPRLATGTGLLLGAVVLLTGAAAYAAARHATAGPRALLLAAAGGVALGTTSALARVVAAATLHDRFALFSWLTVIALAVGLWGALLVQNAYRTGHFTAAYATLLVADPVAGAGIGAALLGEALPNTLPTQLLALTGAALAVTGTVALASARNRNPAARHYETSPDPVTRPSETPP